MKYDYDVSVCLITYNQENTIEQALLSILNQDGSYSIEILIGDDASSDNTFNILSKYQLKYPKILKLYRRLNNVGATNNLGMLIDEAQGKYIAILEGDDYWMTYSKLSEQIQYMKAHNDVSICFHTTIVYRDDDKIGYIPTEAGRQDDYNFTKLLRFGPFMHLSSILFRRSVFTNLPTLFYLDKNICDYSLFLILSESSKIGYIPNIYSAYRLKSSVSSWSSADEIIKAKQSYDYLLQINSFYSNKYSIQLSGQIIGYIVKIFICHWKASEYEKSFAWFKLIFTSRFILSDRIRALFKIIFLIFGNVK